MNLEYPRPFRININALTMGIKFNGGLPKKRRWLFIIFAFFTFACQQNPKSVESFTKIIGGEITSGFPEVGGLTYYGRLFCSATLIESKTVLTAAHCLDNHIIKFLGFMVGSSQYETVTSYKISGAIKHPDYRREGLENDLAILELAGEPAITPMKLVREDNSDLSGKKLIAVGYGRSEDINKNSGIKRFVELPVSEVTHETYRSLGSNKNTCTGDSGGPLLFRNVDNQFYQVGVVSSGDPYCRTLSIFTRVDRHLDFIRQGKVFIH
ncbi:MAG: serine protease [Oligoflexales bacterium]|nr:serine protease [Oligoflexales bacterium]